MDRRMVRLICLALASAAWCISVSAEDFTNALHAYLHECVHAEIPNGCIVVGIVDEHGSRVVAIGTLDNGSDQPADADTVFTLRSMTGTFTTLLLHNMVDRGEMKLDDPVAIYLPDSVKVPTYQGKQITLRHLVTETSGLPGYRDAFEPKRADNPRSEFTVERMYTFVSSSRLIDAPGTKHRHGGVDRGLLGQAMALKTGTDFESLLIDRICRPLKMDSTRFTLTPALEARRATEHNQSGYAVPNQDWGVLKPLAGLYSTANDLLKFISAIELAPFSLTPLMERSPGCFPSVSMEPGILSTGGGGFGARAFACFDKTRRRGLVVLSTSANLTSDLGNYLLDSEWQSDQRPTATNLSSRIHDSYVGQYEAVGARFRARIGIRRDGDRLFGQVIGTNPEPAQVLLPPITAELVAQSETRFFERLSGRPVTFSRSTRGRVTGLTMTYMGKAVSFKKVSDLPPKASEPVTPRVAIQLDPNLLDACVGQYQFAPAASSPDGAKLKIWREGDHLAGQVRGKDVIKGAFDIYAESETNFFLTIDGSRLSFIKNDKAQVTAVIHHSSHQGVPDAQGRKLSDPPP